MAFKEKVVSCGECGKQDRTVECWCDVCGAKFKYDRYAHSFVEAQEGHELYFPVEHVCSTACQVAASVAIDRAEGRATAAAKEVYRQEIAAVLKERDGA